MRKTKFLGKVLSLALVVTLIAGMVPEMRAKAAEGENSGWIQVTEDNKNDLDTKVAVLDNLSQTTYDKFVFNAELAHRDIKSSKKGYYILGKKDGKYICLYGTGIEVCSKTLDTIDNSAYDYYFFPSQQVKLNLDGGKWKTDTITTVAGVFTDLPIPTKEGYIFTGWYEDPQSEDPQSNKEDISLRSVYNGRTEINAHWCEKWPEGSKDWVKATTIKELESADLPFFTLSEAKRFVDEYLAQHPYPNDAHSVIIGRIYNYSTVCYIDYDTNTEYGGVGYNPVPESLEQDWMSKYTYYVLRTPGTTSDDSENPSVTPTPAPAPVTPTPAPAPVTPTTAPSAGDASSDSADSGSSAPEPVLTTTNIAGEQITGWDAITKVISTQTKDKQQNVSGANQDLLHVDASGFDKTIPAATVKAVSTSALRGLHVFIGNSDAVTFLAKSKLSGYKETSFEHKDTVTEHSRTIDFTDKQALGTGVVFHTTVPVKNGEVTVYKVDANGRTRIVKTVSNAGGQVCFPITETATYVLEY
jgi:uncharacterized repeat protein (TIGR02543 family)